MTIMNVVAQIAVCCVVTLACASLSSAKAWRGIVPLHATRADVERILGKPTWSDDTYELPQGTIEIMYAKKRCEQGVPSGWGNWNVPVDTVVNISIEVDFPVKDLKIRNLERYKWYTDDSLTTYYRLAKQGLEYSVRDGRVTNVTYGPTTQDNKLL